MKPAAVGDGSARGYFEAIEEEFIRLRGAPLLLSPADWQLAQGWKQQGVPLFLVLESIREVFARRAERQEASPEAPKRRVSSLRYCRAAVEKAWAERQELGAAPPVPSRQATIDVSARLAALADAMPANFAGVDSWRRRLLDLQGTAPEVEERLIELDAELADRAFESLAQQERDAFVASAEEVLQRTARRVEHKRLPELRRRLVRRLVREHFSLPLLSLFAEPAAPLPRAD